MSKTSSKKKTRPIPKYTFFPAILISGLIAVWAIMIIPQILKLTNDELYIVPNSTGVFCDYFIRGREIIVFAAGLLLLLFWLGERIFPDAPLPSPLIKERRGKLLLIACGGIVLLAVVSCLFSQYRELSFLGIATDSNGLASVIGGVLIMLSSYDSFSSEKSMKILDMGVTFSSAVLGILFILDETIGPLAETFFGITDERTGTALMFGNSANCGAYCAVLFPAALFFAAQEQRIVLRYIKLLFAGILPVIVLSSYSSAAVYGVLFAVVLVIVFAFINRATRVRRILICTAVLLVPTVLLLICSPNVLLKQVKIGMENSKVYSPQNSFGLTGIHIDEDTLILENQDTSLTLKLLDENTAQLFDSSGEMICMLSEDSVQLEGEYSKIKVSVSERLMVLDLGYDDTIEFEITDGIFAYIGINGYLYYNPTESVFPELSGLYSIGTGRGYIWLNTLAMLKDCIIIGRGAGNYAFYFPHDDIVGMLNTHGTTALMTDKPHELYLGLAFSYGIPAMLLFMFVCVLALKNGFGDSFKRKSIIYYGITVSTAVFLFIGIANDLNVTNSILFWCFAGISVRGIASAEQKG